jgi:hypothetical protein
LCIKIFGIIYLFVSNSISRSKPRPRGFDLPSAAQTRPRLAAEEHVRCRDGITRLQQNDEAVAKPQKTTDYKLPGGAVSPGSLSKRCNLLEITMIFYIAEIA